MSFAKAATKIAEQAGQGPQSRILSGLSRWQIALTAQLADQLIIFAMAAVALRFWVDSPWRAVLNYSVVVLLVAFGSYVSFLEGHLYRIDVLIDETRSSKSTILRWTLIFGMLAAAGALAREPLLFSRLWFCSFYVGGAAALVGARCVGAMLIRHWVRGGNFVKSVVFVGANEMTARLISRFEDGRSGIQVAGVFDTDDTVTGPIRGVPVLGGIDDLLAFTKLRNPDLVVLTVPVAETGPLKQLIRRLREQPLNIRLVPGDVALQRAPATQLSRHELPGVQLLTVANRPISAVGLLVKEVIDRAAAALALALLSPLLLVVACAIAMTSPGPVFFRQARVGYNGHVFRIFKFRTMHHEFSGSYAPTLKGDPRIFRLGKFLRKSSLDELPQLINVLVGDMSLVGPRPHMVGQKLQDEMFFEEVDDYLARHRVKPGITGWAQVNGWRGPAHTLEQIQRRVEHDIYYIENWSIWLDIVILVRTVLFGFFGENAF